jgi:hypothetical protein
MGALFQAGFDLANSATPFGHEPPPYPAPLAASASPEPSASPAASEQPAPAAQPATPAPPPTRQSQDGGKPGAEQ